MKKAKSIIIGIVILVLFNVFLLGIQTVSTYTLKTSDGEKVVFGFDRGFGGFFSKYHFSINDNYEFTVTKEKNNLVEGYLANEGELSQVASYLAENQIGEISTESKKKVTYTVYGDDDKTYCIGYFDKAEDLGYVAYTVTSMSQDDALDLYSRFQGTKGIGNRIAFWLSD